MAVISDVLIETDARGRANLSKFGRNARFLARQESDGTVILEPAEIVTAAQERLRRNPDTIAQVQKAQSEREKSVIVDIAL